MHVHLSCESCSELAWSHQQIAVLAEQITQRLLASAGEQAVSPLKPLVAEGSRTETHSLGKNGPRTRTGCFTCRGKRVKCDEAKVSWSGSWAPIVL